MLNRRRKLRWSGHVSLLLALLGSLQSLQAAAITTGNILIYRVGDAAGALGTTAAAVFIDEYTPAGTLVQSIPAPTTGATAMTAVGNATSEGIITRSQDGNYLIFTGYRKDAGGTNPSSDAPATTNRVISTLDLSGTLSTAIGVTDSTGTARSATSVDGISSFYQATSGSVRYIASPGAASTGTVIDARNSREVYLSDGTLYASNGSTAITAKVQSYGTLPTGTTAPTPVITLGTTDAVNGFWMFDLSPSVTGDDTIYALSTVSNTLLKYSFDGSSWVSNGSISASGAQNITGVASGSTVDLFLTSGSTLFKLTDANGHNSALGGSLSTLATAGTNTAFRGIGIFVPEPSAAGLGILGVLALFLPRRRQK